MGNKQPGRLRLFTLEGKNKQTELTYTVDTSRVNHHIMGDNIVSEPLKQLPNEQRKEGETIILDFSAPPPPPVHEDEDEELPSYMRLWRTHKWRIVAGLVVVVIVAIVGGIVGATIGNGGGGASAGSPLVSLNWGSVRERHMLIGHADAVYCSAFSPDGAFLVSGGGNPGEGDPEALKVWDTQNWGTVLATLQPPGGFGSEIDAVAFSPDGEVLVTGSSGLKVWDTQNWGRVLWNEMGESRTNVWALAFSPDGAVLVSGGDGETLTVWDTQNWGTVLATLNGNSGSVNTVAFSPDGAILVSGSSDDNTLKVWDTQNWGTVLATLTGHSYDVRTVAFSPDGAILVSGGNDYTLKVWDTQNWGTVLATLTGHRDNVRTVAFSPDGAVLVSGAVGRWLPGRSPLANDTLKVWY